MCVHWVSIGIKGIQTSKYQNQIIFIEISVCFEEPFQEVELIEEETVEIPSRSTDHSDDENGSEGSNISNLMYS